MTTPEADTLAPEIPTPKPEVYGGRYYCTVEPRPASPVAWCKLEPRITIDTKGTTE